MLGRIFLGKPSHWLAAVIATAALYGLGLLKLHVTDFNLFTAAVGAVTIFLIAVVLLTTRPGEQVTRDEIPLPKD